VRQALRIAAVFCLLGAAPLAFVEFLWLPATVNEFVQLQHDPAPWATPSYHESRDAHLNHVRHALLLYALGTAAVCGLCIVAANVLSWKGDLAIWSVTAIAGGGIAQFISAMVVPGRESTPAYFFGVYIPLVIGVIAAAAAILTLASRFLRNSTASKFW
jgi:hypothetical protein